MSCQESVSEIPVILRKLFFKYSSAKNKISNSFIQFKKFLQMMQDAQVIDKHFTSQKLELIFCSQNKHKVNMDFATFQEAVPRILQEKYPTIFKVSPGEALCKLLDEHFWPLASAIDQEEQPNFSEQIDEDCKQVMLSVHQGLRSLYSTVFNWELRKDIQPESIVQKSLVSLNYFIRNFDISPSLVSKGQITKWWNELVLVNEGAISEALQFLPSEEFEVGTCFTLSKFALLLHFIASKGYEEDDNLKSSPPAEKLMVLLERLEMSKGFEEVSLKVRNITLIPHEEIVHSIIYSDSRDLDEFSETSRSLRGESKLDDTMELNIGASAAAALENYMDKIKHIFQAYCSFGEPMNTVRMSSTKLVKMMRDCGMLKGWSNESVFSMGSSKDSSGYVSKEQVDIIYATIADKKSKRLDFRRFLKALERVAKKAFPSQALDSSLPHLIENHILYLENEWNDERGVSSNYIKSLMEMLRDPEVIEALSLVHKSVIYFFKHYTDLNGLMDFRMFMRFCRDFAVFPDLIPKSKLLRFFHTLAGIHSQTEQPDISVSRSVAFEKKSQEEPVIDEHLFVEGLALIAAEVLYEEPEPNSVERICYLIERMSESEGPSKVLREEGHNRSAGGECVDMLKFLKARYPSVFQDTQREFGFKDILAELQGGPAPE